MRIITDRDDNNYDDDEKVKDYQRKDKNKDKVWIPFRFYGSNFIGISYKVRAISMNVNSKTFRLEYKMLQKTKFKYERCLKQQQKSQKGIFITCCPFSATPPTMSLEMEVYAEYK